MKLLIMGGCPRSGTGALAQLLTRDARAIVTIEQGIDNWKNSINFLSEEDKKNLRYVGDKMPEGYLSSAGNLVKRYPQAKFLFTNRNGWDVVGSYPYRLLRTQTESEILKNKSNIIRLARFGETIWLRSYQHWKNLPKTIPNGNYLTLRWEDNLADTTEMCRKLGEYLEYDTPVNNRLIWDTPTKMYVPFYRRVRETFFKEPKFNFMRDVIVKAVSQEFKDRVKEYEGEK